MNVAFVFRPALPEIQRIVGIAGPCSTFNDQETLAAKGVRPVFESRMLLGCSSADPLAVIKHQDIGTRDFSTFWTSGEFGSSSKFFQAHVQVQGVCGPRSLMAWNLTLKVVK